MERSWAHQSEQFTRALPQHHHQYQDRRPYPFLGTVLMGSLLNIAIFKLSPRTNAAHFVAISVLGSLGVNSMHAILKLAGHTNSFLERMEESDEESYSPAPYVTSMQHQEEVYDSNIRLLHVLFVKPLSGLSERLIGPLSTIKGVREIAGGIFHHTDYRYTYNDGRRDIQLFIAAAVTAIALKKIAPWVKPSLQADWQTVCTAVLIPTLWAKSTQLSQPYNGDPGKPWSWIQSIMGSLSDRYNRAVSQRGTGRRD
ncbi:MAG: hypothetical protein KFB93_07610 [Simkaniaceae bacterium]|nr:MAG: hypothetical protein KFB93_07610 [Simkaniaceae bacterium]